MSIIYNCPAQRNPAQIRRCWAARNILSKYNTPIQDVSVNIEYDHAIIKYLKTHKVNVARLEYPQIVVNNNIVGPVAELQAADEDGRLANFVRSVPHEIQQAIALNASLLEESNKSHELQREKERREHEEEKKKLAAQLELQQQKLREEQQREEERRKERELKLLKKREADSLYQSQRDIQINQISEKIIAVQNVEKDKVNQRKAYNALINEDEEMLKSIPEDMRAMVNQIHGILPQLFKRSIIPICQRLQSFEAAIDFVFENQEKLEAEQPKFPLLDIVEEPVPSMAASLLESSLLISAVEEQAPSAAVEELVERNSYLESENAKLKEEFTKFKLQQLQFLMALRDETKEELKNLDRKLEKQLAEVETTRRLIGNASKKLELIDNQVIEFNASMNL